MTLTMRGGPWTGRKCLGFDPPTLGTLATSFTWRHALDGFVDWPPTYNSRGNPRRRPTRTLERSPPWPATHC
jgi:hypothetical protein